MGILDKKLLFLIQKTNAKSLMPLTSNFTAKKPTKKPIRRPAKRCMDLCRFHELCIITMCMNPEKLSEESDR